MIDVINLEGAFNNYRETNLKQRLLVACKLELFNDEYSRIPETKILKVEQKNNIVTQIYRPKAVYLSIIHGYIKFLMAKVFEGRDVRIPAKIGIIGVRGKKIKPTVTQDGQIYGLVPSWGKTFKLRKENEEAKNKKTIVYCFNEHTNGIRYKIVWVKKDVVIANKTLYGLVFSRNNKRTLYNLLMKGKEYLITPEKI